MIAFRGMRRLGKNEKKEEKTIEENRREKNRIEEEKIDEKRGNIKEGKRGVIRGLQTRVRGEK